MQCVAKTVSGRMQRAGAWSRRMQRMGACRVGACSDKAHAVSGRKQRVGASSEWTRAARGSMQAEDIMCARVDSRQACVDAYCECVNVACILKCHSCMRECCVVECRVCVRRRKCDACTRG
eukprot:355736-Chlamydomonas_euryale.AAC.11